VNLASGGCFAKRGHRAGSPVAVADQLILRLAVALFLVARSISCDVQGPLLPSPACRGGGYAPGAPGCTHMKEPIRLLHSGANIG
jgi:hypothetical protein